MRKWLFLIGVVIAIYGLSRKNTRRPDDKSSIFQRINWTITVLAWVLTISFGLAFLYWLYTVIFK